MREHYWPDDIQEKYDLFIDYVNRLPLSDDEKQELIDRADDVITWLWSAM